MKRFLILALALSMLLAACGPESSTVTVLSVDQDTGVVEVETGDGQVFTITAPPGYDLSALEAGMVIDLSEGLQDAFEDSLEDSESDEEARGAYCKDGAGEHPALANLAEESGTPYADLLALFCEENFGVGELRVALRYAEEAGSDLATILALHEQYGNWGVLSQAIKLSGDAGISFTEVLALYDSLGNWGKVRQELGLTGKPDDTGKPDNPGKPDDPGGGNGNGNGNGNGGGEDDGDD
ncbi:MAG: hypothetical protein HYZ26_01100 [Chloroflexi bacterium]|nr:hypothetical protein [Chloroflexota bacterium]